MCCREDRVMHENLMVRDRECAGRESVDRETGTGSSVDQRGPHEGSNHSTHRHSSAAWWWEPIN